MVGLHFFHSRKIQGTLITGFTILHGFHHPLYAALFTAKDNGVDFYSRVSAYEEKNTFWKHVFEHSEFKLFPDDVKKWILESESFTYSIAFAKSSAICINSFSGDTLSENQIEIIKRF